MDENEKRYAYSDEISRFLCFLENAKRNYAHALEELAHQEQREADYLHLLELRCTRPEDVAIAASLLKCALVARRESKDTISILEPLIQFLETERGKMLINQLPQLVGKIRKEEKRVAERTYSPRAMSYDEYDSILGGSASV